MEQNQATPDDDDKNRKLYYRWWEKLCLRCHQEDTTPSWQPSWWSKIFPFPIFSTYRQSAQQICIIIFFLLTWGILYSELGEAIGLQGELLSMSLLVITAYLVGWIWLKVTTLPALIGMLLTGIAFQNLQLVHMTDSYRKLNQDLRKIALVIILTRAGLGLDAGVLRKHYAAVLQLGLLPWLVECVAIAVSTHYLLYLPWIWSFLLGSMIASVSPAVVVPCLFRLRDVGYGVSKGIPTIVVAAAAVDDSISVAIFAIILNAMFSTGSATFNIIKGPLSIIAGIVIGSLWGAMTAVIPEKGDTYVVPLRFLALFLGGLFSYFISSMIGWSGAGPLAIVASGFVAAFFWEKQGWPVNKNPVSNVFRILWIFFEPILFAFTGAQVTISALDPQMIKMGAICLVSCLVLRAIATFFMSFGCGLNNKEKLFIGLTWTAKATVQAALGPAALDLVNSGQTSGASKEHEEYYAKAILAVSVLSVMLSAPLGALLIAITGPKLLSKDDYDDDKNRKLYYRWWEKLCLRCHQEDTTPSWQPSWWSKIFPFPIFSTYRQSAQQICIIIFFLLTWGILYSELGEAIGLQGELLSMSLLVITAYLVGWIWLKVTTLPALIGMLLTGIAFQNLQLVHMTDSYRKLNQDLRKIALVIILTRAGLGLDAGVLRKHYAAVLQLGLLPWLVECVAIAVSTHYLLYLPWIWSFLLGSMIASVSPAVVVPCLFRLRDVGYGVSKGIPTIVVAAAAVDDSISVAIFAIILNAMFSTGSATFNIIKGPLSIIAGIVIGSLWGAMTAVIPEKGDTYVVPLRFLALFLGGLFSYFISSMIGWSGAGPLAIVASGFVAAFFWEKQGWPVNKNPVSNVFRILWIFFEPILFAFTGAQVTISALDPQMIKMGAICLVSCLVLRAIATFFMSFGCGLNNKEKLFIGLTWTAKATVQAALGPAALDLVNSGQTSGASKEHEEYYAKAILAVSVLSVMLSAPLGALLIAITGPKLLSKDDSNEIHIQDTENQQSTQI